MIVWSPDVRGCAPLLLIAAAASLAGCATNMVELSELPEDPIAFRYWVSEDGRQRKERLGEVEQKTPIPLREGIAELGNLNSLFGRDSDGDIERRFPSRLALLNPRTLEVEFVGEAPPGSRPLSWSADHKRLIFSTERLTGSYQIYELDIETRIVTRLSYGEGGIVAAAHGSDDSYVFAKVYEAPGKGLAVDLMEYRRGRGERRLAENTLIRHVAVSPDGGTVVFAPQGQSRGGKRSPLSRMVSLSTEPGSEPRVTVAGEHPVFTKDGGWVVFSGRKGDRAKVYRMRPDGSGRTAVGIGAREELTPAVSGDGDFIVYVSEHNGLNRLFVLRFDGTGDRLLYDGAMAEWPIW